MDVSRRNAESQNSDISENGLQKMEKSALPASTVRATSYGVKKFGDWVIKRNKTCDFIELNELLRKFYAEVKPQKAGGSLSASTLTGLRAAIHRHITGAPFNRQMNVIKDREFSAANKMFTARCKLFFKVGNPKPRHKPAIGDTDMKKLGQYFKRWSEDPLVLVEAVWFFLCFYFGRRGREGWTQMTVNTFGIEMDSEGHEYVYLKNTEVTKNHQGGHKQRDIDYNDQRMYGPGVEVLKFYFTKHNPQNDRLFQTPLKVYKRDAIWYRNEPIGKNVLSSMMQRISNKAQLSHCYTCDSVRASTVTILYQAGISTQSIISVTKHKNTSSLGHYIQDLSSDQKREVCNVLTSALGDNSGDCFPSTSKEEVANEERNYSTLSPTYHFSDTEDTDTVNFDLGYNFEMSQVVERPPVVETPHQAAARSLDGSLAPVPVVDVTADSAGAFSLPLQTDSPAVFNVSNPVSKTPQQDITRGMVPSNVMSNATFNNCTINFQLKQM